MAELEEPEQTVAYVLIKAELGMARCVAEEVSTIEGVVFADVITGPYDVVAGVMVPTNRELGSLVIEGIQNVTGVKNPLTLVGSSSHKNGGPVPLGHSWG